MKPLGIRLLTVLAVLGLTPFAFAGTGVPEGAVFTMSNDPANNEILMYDRGADGALSLRASFATGGAGTGTGLGNQGAVLFSEGYRWLFAVNAGSDEISVFRVLRNRLALVGTTASGGQRPISLAIDRDRLYVLNAGGADGGVDEITGFLVGDNGALSPIAGSTQPLSAADTGPAQISFTPDGRQLVVTEKATQTIDVFPVDDQGVAGMGVAHASPGATPFGFGFGKRGQIFVTEANGGTADASSVSSFSLDCDGALSVIAASVATEETAACWLGVTPNGRYAYTTNTGDGTLTGFRVMADGNLALLQNDGQSASTGPDSAPIDLGIDPLGLYLYTLDSGSESISAFRILPDGSLFPLMGFGVAGLPDGANGLAVR